MSDQLAEVLHTIQAQLDEERIARKSAEAENERVKTEIADSLAMNDLWTSLAIAFIGAAFQASQRTTTER